MHFTSQGGVTCQVAVHKSVHNLVRCVTARNLTAIANILRRNAQSRPELVKVVQRDVANEFAALCSTTDNSKFRCTNDDNHGASFTKQKKEIELKAPVMWEIMPAASINVQAMRRNKTKTVDSILPAVVSVFATLLSIHFNSIILRRGAADKMTFK